jgi:hypothetical protein
VSSTILYLAIVAVWAVVLVPMWLRRDTEATTLTRILHRRHDDPAVPEDLPVAEDPLEEDSPAPADEEEPAEPVTEPARRRPGRAAVIARRRRRTSGLSLLLVATVIAITTGLAPWWTVLAPIGLLAGHLCLLRVAVGMDAARRQAHLAARATARAAAQAAEEASRREAEEAAHAEVIELRELDARNRTRAVFDQYAEDGLRAVGD